MWLMRTDPLPPFLFDTRVEHKSLSRGYCIIITRTHTAVTPLNQGALDMVKHTGNGRHDITVGQADTRRSYLCVSEGFCPVPGVDLHVNDKEDRRNAGIRRWLSRPTTCRALTWSRASLGVCLTYLYSHAFQQQASLSQCTSGGRDYTIK